MRMRSSLLTFFGALAMAACSKSSDSAAAAASSASASAVPVWPQVAADPVPDAATDGPATPDVRAIKNFAALQPEFRHCYDAALARDASLQGSVTINLEFASDGTVIGLDKPTDVVGVPPDMVRCLQSSLAGARLAHPSSGNQKVKVPFKFTKA
jgi:hypothetical protein